MKQLLATLFAVSCCHATIIEVKSFDELMPYFEKANTKTLALFDIDMVLIQPEDPAFQMANMVKFRTIVKESLADLTPEQKDLSMALMLLSSSSQLIDQRFPLFLQALHRRSIPLMALTSNLTGSFADVENFESWKIARLKDLGIDFEAMSPYKDDMIFDLLPRFRDSFSRYTQGILFVNGSHISKGEALLHFLEKSSLKPEAIIFVDDRLENVQSVQERLFAKHPEIAFTGLHFTAAKSLSSLPLSENEFRQKWQQLIANPVVLKGSLTHTSRL